MQKLSVGVSALVTAGLAMTLLFACNQQDDNRNGVPGANQNKLSVYLTDAPARFDKVLVDIKSVAVKIDTSSSWWGQGDGPGGARSPWGANCGNKDRNDAGALWDTLDITPGVYNLLDFANGTDTLLANANVAKGKIIAFRLELGTDNSLVKDSVTYPLKLVPGWDDIYIRVYGENFQKVNDNHYKIWIDFDAGHSVIRVRQGTFYLKPVLRAFAVSTTGGVKGTVLPFDAEAVISMYNATDTAYAIPGRSGMFMVRGLEEGSYTVFVNASGGYQDTTLTGVQVTAGKQTDLGVLQLHN